MNERTFLRESDVRAMVRLLGETVAVQGDHAKKKRFLMDGLCRLVAADYWVWALCAEMVPGRQPVYIANYTGGFAPEQFSRFMRAVDHPRMAELTARFAGELQRHGSHLTRTRQQCDPEGGIAQGEIGALWREAGIGPILLSFRPLENGGTSAIALYRQHDRPLFQEREARVAHIVLTEVSWLHAQGWPGDLGQSVPQLPRRARTVLTLLIQGLSRKEIAAGLKISEHTANEYVKQVYRHFGVRSQAQLMKRFLQGDGGDTPPVA